MTDFLIKTLLFCGPILFLMGVGCYWASRYEKQIETDEDFAQRSLGIFNLLCYAWVGFSFCILFF
jgi:hypothetical protein